MNNHKNKGFENFDFNSLKNKNITSINKDQNINIYKDYLKKQIKIYNEYLNYNWDIDENWKLFILNIYPKPNLESKILYLKKKYYKRNINEEFDITLTPEDYDIYIKIKYYLNTNSVEKNEFVNSVNNLNVKSNIRDVDSLLIFKSNFVDNVKKKDNYLVFQLLYAINNFFWILSILYFFNSIDKLSLTYINTACILSILLNTEYKINLNKMFKDNKHCNSINKKNNSIFCCIITSLLNIKYDIHFQLIIYLNIVLYYEKLNHVLLSPILPIGLLNEIYYFSTCFKLIKFVNKFFESLSNKYDSFIYSLYSIILISIGIILFLGYILNVNKGLIIVLYWIYIFILSKYNIQIKKIFTYFNLKLEKVETDKYTPKFISKIFFYFKKYVLSKFI